MRVSAEQVALRWRPALRQTGGLWIQSFSAQVCQYLLDHRRVFDAGDDFPATAADAARFDVDINTRFKRYAQLIAAWSATGVTSSARALWSCYPDLAAPASPTRDVDYWARTPDHLIQVVGLLAAR